MIAENDCVRFLADVPPAVFRGMTGVVLSVLDPVKGWFMVEAVNEQDGATIATVEVQADSIEVIWKAPASANL